MRSKSVTLAPQAKRSGEREGARRGAAGWVRGLGKALKRPLTLPLLGNESLPLPSSRGEGLDAGERAWSRSAMTDRRSVARLVDLIEDSAIGEVDLLRLRPTA